MSKPLFQGWYHCTLHTYGAWLRGEAKGWRARHHREHVEGDYKNPPPAGQYDQLLEQSKKLMKRPPVILNVEERNIVCAAVVQKFEQLKIQLAALSVSAMHVHLLAKFPWPRELEQSPGMAIPGLCVENSLQDGRNPIPRHVLGLVKKHSSHVLRKEGFIHQGGVWGTRSFCDPLRDDGHFENTKAYIQRHAGERAAIWLSS